MTDTVLEFDRSKMKPRRIDRILPWPPSEAIMREMEEGKITEASFELHLKEVRKAKSQDHVMRELENRQKL